MIEITAKTGKDSSWCGTAVATAKRRLGSIPGCIGLGAADIGEATLENGETVLITWGRNLTAEKQYWYGYNTQYTPVWVGAVDGSAELIFPEDIAAQLVSLFVIK